MHLSGLRRARTACVLAIGAGLVAASAVGLSAPAQASPYPSWSDVQAAKGNQAKAQKEIDALSSAITSLQNRAGTAMDAASGAGERYQVAVLAQQSAAADLKSLKSQQAEAASKAKLSRDRVGQLVAELSHSGGGQLTVTMLTQSKHAGNLLYQLGAMTNLTERTRGLLEQATADEHTATALSDQAASAQSALAERTADAASALKQANSAADTASAALAVQTKNQSQLISQVAYLKGTTAAVETQYYNGQAAGTIADTVAAPSPAKSGGSKASGSGSGGSGSGGSTTPSKAPNPAPSPSKSTTPVAPKPPVSTPKPPVTTPPVTTPPSSGSSAAVNTAIAFAKAQVGKGYVFGGAGPNVYDCSGLMMASYNAAGVYIGGHSVRYQYDYLLAQGRMVPLSQARAGDILIYHNGPDGYYHDAMYLGGGMMIEAPNPSALVRIVPIRYTQLMTTVGRPVG
ncbi:hypothetical protein AX769_04775 [Frondihabitans sp. PAMC 28766]|nr:hypothetical protein AX769_04775 [Frondihabitans sp. PAMC 28766]